ncbi:sensor histidine kinase [Paractinoplanes rishiriensis]|nr:histidine kinase [Actinoplanes rishiriensis]
MRWQPRLALAAALLTGAVLSCTVVLVALAPVAGAFLNLAIGLAAAPASALLGVIVARRRPGNLVGLMLTLVGLTTAVNACRDVFWWYLADRRPAALPELDWLAAVGDQSAVWIFVAVALLLLYFPDGELPGPWWRWVPPTLVAAAAADHLGASFDSLPFRAPLQDIPRPWGPLPLVLEVPALAAFVLELALVLACAASLLVRFRRSDRLQRQQIKWLALAGFAIPLYPLLCLVEILLWGRPLWFSGAVGLAGLIGVPVATTVAMLRHDLYDVDKALAATVTYGLVTTMLVGTYAVLSAVGGLVFGRGSEFAAAGATAVCAIALSPLRSRLQRVVDRRLYPIRRAALAAIDALSRETRGGEARPEQLQSRLRLALREPDLRIGFQVPGTAGYIDADGAPVEPAGAVPVELGGRTIGVLRPGSDALRPELLRQIAGAAATLVEVIRLRLEVAQALREVESSRARLVQAGYTERRRLERDLHDGAQQRLASLGMAFRLAQRHLGDGSVDVNALLDQGVAELGTALAELRKIAYGLRPGRLDDGLDAALTELVRTVPIAVELDICDDRLPDDVATTAYYVVSEAITNVVKHATADRIALQVNRSNGRLTISVSDDGCGGAALSQRSGMADRVAALGGTLRVHSPTGAGTVVEAVLPCAS